MQTALPGAKFTKYVIRALLTRWAMHYQSFRRLRELHATIVMVIDDDEQKLVNKRCVISGDTETKAKVMGMVKLIRNLDFWNALSVYVEIQH